VNKAVLDRIVPRVMNEPAAVIGETKQTSSGLNLYPESAVLGLDLESFRWQESTFAMLNLALLAALLCGHALFSEHFGTPTPPLVGLLSTGFLLQLGELVWIQTRRQPLNGRAIRTLTLSSIVWDVALALLLGVLIDRVDSPYYVLMLVPVLLSAFRRSLLETLAVVIAASASQFLVVWHFFQLHSPVEPDEYFEAGTISLIFLLTGVLVWFLVNHLRRQESGLAENLLELSKARERLLQEEKLAAVGRLSAAIAHEIRNPVAMISSSLATAIRSPLAPREREEMFDIAAKEAERLERLTNDFLAYARPRAPECQPANVMDNPGICGGRLPGARSAATSGCAGGRTGRCDGIDGSSTSAASLAESGNECGRGLQLGFGCDLACAKRGGKCAH